MKNVAEMLLDIEAIKLSPSQPFTWASGTLSPIYCDNRVTLSFPEVRNSICNHFVSIIKEKYPTVEAIVGVATGGIAHGMLVADRMNLPFAYVRDKPKQHGRQNIVEGFIAQNTKVVVIEDLISTGGSSLKAVDALREYGVEVLGLAAIFTYNFQKSIDAFHQANCPFTTITSFVELINQIDSSGKFSKEEISEMKEWYTGF